jgi:hypothetical protein
MGFFDRLFGSGGGQSRQLPSDKTAKEFGEVNVRKTKQGTEVQFTILMEPEGSEAEGWQTGVALDASVSMMNSYGRGLLEGPAGAVPQSLLAEYQRKNWIQVANDDGQQRVYW